MVDTKKLLEQAKAYDTSRGVIAAAPVNPEKRTSASAGGVDTAKLLAQAKAYDAAKSADPRQAAQTAPNTPVAKGSFTGNRETTYTPKFSAGKLVAGTVEKGLNEFSQGIGATGAALEKVLLSPLDLVTGEKFGTAASEIGLFSKARENDRKTGERLQQKYASNVEAGGKAAQLVDKYGTMTVAAIPDALLAARVAMGN